MGYLSTAIERSNYNDLLRRCTRKVNATRPTSDWPDTGCLGETKEGGGVRPPSPPRHDTTAPEEPFCARGSIRLSLLLYFFIMDLLTRTCLSGSSFISSLPLGFRVGSSLFGIPFVKPNLLCEPFILFL